ncbi:Uncharacterized protein T10_12237 [Trichinella papuae]|uniref:Integrase catalytic domain-containing protein n=1 Tax=Trichinella papuae TaxID=268474 RepID=A0A0V1MQU3_9BILA|nr:Uncharacterized protein T10_12237 [Trichinella papuae]
MATTKEHYGRPTAILGDQPHHQRLATKEEWHSTAGPNCLMKTKCCYARFYAWWPGLDRDIECLVERCFTCQIRRQTPLEVSLILWNVPSEPWSRLHIDLAGPFKGSKLLVIIDVHSKWLDIAPLRSTTTNAIIKRYRRLFTCFGLPRYIVSDNRPQFVSH